MEHGSETSGATGDGQSADLSFEAALRIPPRSGACELRRIIPTILTWLQSGTCAHVEKPEVTRKRPRLKGHTGGVLGVAVTKDGEGAVSASFDRTLSVWDRTTGKSIASLAGHASVVFGVAVTSEG
jgi:WD40 repeat protein